MLAQGKNVKSIIDDWNNELNAHSRAFMADAQSLAEWDQDIRRNRRQLLEMEAHLNRVCLQQHLLICSMHHQTHIVDCEGNMLSPSLTTQDLLKNLKTCSNWLQLAMHVMAMHMMAGCTAVQCTSKNCTRLLQTV